MLSGRRFLDRRSKLALAAFGALLCAAWAFSQSVQTEEKAKGLRLYFKVPQTVALHAELDIGNGYDAATPILIMLPAGASRMATVPMPATSIRSLRFTLPGPETVKLLHAEWFFTAPEQADAISLEHFRALPADSKSPGLRYQLDDAVLSRTTIQWLWTWQLAAGAAGVLLMLAWGGWTLMGTPAFKAWLQATRPVRQRFWGQCCAWAPSAAMLASLVAAVTVFVSLLRRPPFNDEGDNFVGATILAQGGIMYRDFYSQHPPFVYHLMSAVAALGVHSTEGFRLAWLVFLASIWVSLFFVYRREFGGEFVCLIILGYSFSAMPYLAGQVLNDAPHSFGLLIALLELLRFRGVASMPYKRMLWFGAALFMTTMCAMVSLYPLFPLALAFLWKEFRLGGGTPRRERLRRGGAAFAFMALPFLGLALYYAASGVLQNFYYQAYAFNRLIYSHYLNEYRGNPWAHFLRPPQMFKDYFLETLRKFSNGTVSLHESTPIVMACVAFVAITATYFRTPILAMCLLIFTLMCGDRGYQPTFHAQPFFVVCLGTIALLILQPIRKTKASSLPALIIMGMAGLLFRHYSPAATQVMRQSIETSAATPYDDWVRRHTVAGDTIWQSELIPQLYLNTERMPASRVIDLVPWFYQAYRDQLLLDLQNKKPKVVILNPLQNVWGHYTRNYAPELVQFVSTHYETPKAESRPPKNLWVRKEISSDEIRTDAEAQ